MRAHREPNMLGKASYFSWIIIILCLLALPRGAQAQPGSPRMTASTTTSVTIAWDGVGAGATYESQQVLPRLRSSVNVGSGTTTTITGLSHSTYYGFQIRSILNGVTSDWTGVADGHTKPLAPPNFRATCVAGTFVELKWNAPQQSQVSLSPTSFQYEVKIDSGAWQSRAGSRTRKVGQLSLGTTYTFAVRTVLDRSGFVGYSDASTLTVTTAAAQVEPPTGLQTSEVSDTSVKLTWTASTTTVSSYEVSTDGNTWVDSGSDLEHTFSGLDPETRYSLRARAKSGNSTSCANAAPLVTTLPSAPSAPTGLSTSGISQTAITLGWTKAAGATAYKVRKDSSDSWTTLDDVASHTFTGLTANTQYTLEVIASNSGGDSAAATESASTLPNAPDAPTSLTTSGISQTAITLNWTKAAGATAYKVQVDSGAVTPLGDVATHTFSGLTADTSYTLKVIASNAGGDSSEVSVSESTLPNAPAAPTSLSVDNITQTAARLNWTKSSGATSYEVNGGALSQWTDVGDVATYTFGSLTANTTYNLRVRAVNRAGNSGAAAFSASTLPNIPAAPTGLAASAHTQTAITLGWTKSPGATAYKVQVDSGAVTTLGDVATHTFSGLTTDTAYTLKVIASNAGGDSSATSVSARTLVNAPATPTGLAALGGTHNSITISWSRSTGATGYKVQVDSGTVATLGDVATHTFSGLTADTSYTLNVVAFNSGGDSAAASVSARTKLTTPPVTLGTVTHNSIVINWTKSTGATAYKVRKDSGDDWTTLGDVATHTFSGLTPNTAYDIEVLASNSHGDSAAGAITGTTTHDLDATATHNANLTATHNANLTATANANLTATANANLTATHNANLTATHNANLTATANANLTATANANLTATANANLTATQLVLSNDATQTQHAVNLTATANAPTATATPTPTPTATSTPTPTPTLTNTPLPGSPAAPTNLQTSGISQTAITLDWTKETAANSYEVQGGSHSSWHDVGDVATYEFTGLTADTQYTLKVRSKNSQTTSTGVSVSASTLANAPAAPNDLQASPGGQNNVNLNWPSSAGADSYEIRGSMASNQPSNQAVSVGAISNWMNVGNVNSYVVSGLSPEMTYTFEVRAKNTGGASQPRSTNYRISPSSAPADPPQRDDGDPVQGDSDTDNAGAALLGGSSSSASPTEDPNPKPSVINCSDEQRALFDISALMPGMNVQCLDHNSIFQPNLVARGVVLGVDVWGWVRGDFEVCFKQAGDIVFLDAAYAPRVQTSVTIYSRDGRSCIPLNRAGTLVLLKSMLNSPPPSAPQSSTVSAASAGSAANNQVVAFDDCQVRTLEYINFRESPGGNRILVLSPQVTLTAYDKQGDWFQVDFYGQKGWLHGDYVKPIGDCG